MALNLQDKQEIVAKVSKIAQSALSAVIADYYGVTVDQMTLLRKSGRELGVDIRVVRNTLMRRVVKNTAFECLNNKFTGLNLIAFSNEHPGVAARLFKSFAKDNVNFEVKTAAFKGAVLSLSQIDYLATLPTYEVALSNLIFTIQEAATIKLVRTLAALHKQKEAI